MEFLHKRHVEVFYTELLNRNFQVMVVTHWKNADFDSWEKTRSELEDKVKKEIDLLNDEEVCDRLQVPVPTEENPSMNMEDYRMVLGGNIHWKQIFEEAIKTPSVEEARKEIAKKAYDKTFVSLNGNYRIKIKGDS